MKYYNKATVSKLIKKDPRIKGKESKLIHALLKGRVDPGRITQADLDDLRIDPLKPIKIVKIL